MTNKFWNLDECSWEIRTASYECYGTDPDDPIEDLFKR